MRKILKYKKNHAHYNKMQLKNAHIKVFYPAKEPNDKMKAGIGVES